jgi:hypothetical protein
LTSGECILAGQRAAGRSPASFYDLSGQIGSA